MGKKKKGGKEKTKKAKINESKHSADDLIEKVGEFIDNFDFDLAEKFCERALALEPNHVGALEAAGCIKAELGDLESAKSYFSKAVEIQPDEGHTKYMYLGQINEGKHAEVFYLKGIEVMKDALEKQAAEGSSSKSFVNELELSNAYCSLAEIYMTDSCFDDKAEEVCKKYCDEAVKYGSSNPDAYLVMCNYLISKEQLDEAKALLLNNYSVWGLPSNDGSDPGPFDEAEEQYPPSSYSARMGLSRILLELSEPDKAEMVLGSLMLENDEDIEVWYLLALVSEMKSDRINMKLYLLHIEELREKLGLEEDRDAIFSHVSELLQACKDIDVDADVDDTVASHDDKSDAEMAED